MELTSIQQGKVDELKALFNPSTKVKVDFKAPTGSGKTLMATAFIAELIEQNPNDKFVFVIATPSSSDLPLFFEQKINQYKTTLGFTNFDVEYVKSPSDTSADKKNEFIPKILPERNKVFIFGKSSFGKRRILSTFHIIDDFVQVIKEQGYKLVYIRDEAHIGGKFATDEESRNFERLMQEAASFVLKMTATPDYRDATIQRVILSEEELNNPTKNENKYLIKTKPITLLNGTMTDEDMLANAIKEFKHVKQDYKTLESDGITIRPALLIQVDNDSSTDKEKSMLFFETLAKIKKELSKNGLSWVQYFGDSDKDSDRIYKDKFTLAEITEKDSDIDAVIFKIGPATGWDIPRACMLLQLRNVCSVGFNIQTIGRIKRNCYPQLVKNDITDRYYIYSNAPVEKNVFVFNAKVKDAFAKEKFMSIEITNIKDCSQKIAEERLKKDINGYLADNKSRFIQDIKNIIDVENGIALYKKALQVTASGTHISKYKNVYVFIKEVAKQINANQDTFLNCESLLNKFWKDNLKGEKLYTGVPLIKEFFYLVIIEKHIANISNLINKNRQYKPKYEVKLLPYFPQSYVELYSNENNEETIYSPQYLFDTKYGNKKNTQPIGQNRNSPEAFVFQKLQDIAINKKYVKSWAKNFTTSNVNGAYLDKYNKLCHSFFDFILKFDNDTFLYIEVKSEHDIDPEKTKTLQGAYEEYFERSRELFDRPVVIGVWKVNTSTGKIIQTAFYDKGIFKTDLNTLSVDELIEAIRSKRN